MDLSTRAAGPAAAPGAPDPSAALERELRALIEQIRTLAPDGPGASLPSLAELGAGGDASPGRWLRVALATLGPGAARQLVEQAFQRLAASAGPDARRPLEGARDAALRVLLADQVPPARAAALAILVAEVERAFGEALGRTATMPAVSGAEPEAVAAALVAWLRGEAAHWPPGRLRAVLEAGAARAAEAILRAGGEPAERTLVETIRALALESLATAPAAGGEPLLLYRPDVALATAVAAARRRARGGEPDGRVAAIGEDERADARRDRPDAPPEGEAEASAAHPLEGPMQCVRRTVEAFLGEESAAFTREWVYPACFWADGRWRACADEAALAALHARRVRARREQGLEPGRILLLRVDPVGTTAALVHVLLGEPGPPRREVEWLYTTVRTDAGWRVAAALAK